MEALPDPLRAAYDALPYTVAVHPHTHPARLGALARLHGHRAIPPATARVLDLGCASGANLLSWAAQFPRASFIGVDFSPVQIAAAEKARAARGLGNVRFICADLLDWEPEPGGCDYVIAHGLYSWVPPAVRERLLAHCAKALAPHGVAEVSFNVRAGWAPKLPLRDLLRAQTTHLTDPAAREARARQVLAALAAGSGQIGSAYETLLRENVSQLAASSLNDLMHDDLEEVNEPVSFREFHTHATAHRLAYLCETKFFVGHTAHLPRAAREAVDALAPDFVLRQELLDVLWGCRHRSALLIPGPEPATRSIDLAALADCALGLTCGPLRTESALTLCSLLGGKFKTSDSPHAAVAERLAAAWPASLRLSELPREEITPSLGPWLFLLLSLDHLDVQLFEPDAGATAVRRR